MTTLASALEVAAVVILVLFVADCECAAIPMFARRYNVPCSTCHTSPPRLNETGYEFRAAGFRMPDEIGHTSERPRKLTDYMGFRLQPRFDYSHSSIGPAKQTETEVELFASEGYFWYAPVSRYFSGAVKVTLWPEESTETEQHERVEGVLRFNYGKPDSFIDVRAGVPHPHEGFGGSESYSVSNTKPYIQELKTANFNQDTFFTPLGLHQFAVTAGYYRKRTTIRGAVLSGMRLLRDEDTGELEPFGRKDPFLRALKGSEDAGPDFQIFFNQILHPDGGNLSVYYYNGRSSLPRLDLLPSSEPEDPFDDATRLTAEQAANLTFFKNNFHRLAFYAGYPIRKVSFLGGVQYGRDTIGSGGHFSSVGSFVEGNVKILNDLSVAGLRVDWFDPARLKADNEMLGFTPFVNVWLKSQLRITAEYQFRKAQRGSGELHRFDNQFQLRLYWVK